MIEAIYIRHLQGRPIDREAIKARYLGKNPKQAEFIKSFVKSYSDQLGSEAGENNVEGPTSAHDSKTSSLVLNPSNRLDSQTQDRYIYLSNKTQTRQPATGASASATQLYPIAIHRTTSSSNKEVNNPNVGDLVNDTDHINSARLQDFKDHIAGNLHRRTSDVAHPSPSLELQWQFLATSDDGEKKIGDTLLIEYAVLISPLLESRGYSLPSQYALLGKNTTAVTAVPDFRIMQNTNIPFSAFVCGVQGSGKSHTTACMIENCSMTMPALGTLKSPISTLVLQFDEYSSTVSSQPSEAAFLAKVMPQYAQERPVPLRVLVSPTNYHNLNKMYSQIPNIEVQLLVDS